MRLRQSMTTRQGRKVPRMLYEQMGSEPADDDPIIGLVDTPELAALIVTAVNAWTLNTEIREGSGGRRKTWARSLSTAARGDCRADRLLRRGHGYRGVPCARVPEEPGSARLSRVAHWPPWESSARGTSGICTRTCATGSRWDAGCAPSPAASPFSLTPRSRR